MAADTHTTQTANVPSGQEIYDAIMAGIEPELVTTNLETLDEKYTGETPEQKQQRAARYNAAFAEYDKQFAVYHAQWNDHLRTHRRNVIASMELEYKQKEAADLSAIESSLAA